ncbi:isoprenylcysteine carboxyl methyltransferase family protein [Streptococcus sp. S784/96/1]|uniref:isoprenylcysteine carboxyl methyltransferase family protein n=1 Tax=Streptococcus sp. S784/96/1 TaxID=2653499 RepID=UPI0013872422|nr:isoprenylcysteine carboxyl methyltransferase family protein [Streptococcus sp. S784/96/1]
MILMIVGAIFILRLAFLTISKKNEADILANGGIEYGVKNTKLLTVAHILFYLGCFVEAYVRHTILDQVGFLGLGLLLFAFIMLCVVIHLLSDIWTVKLMIAKNHQFNNHWLFRVVKHPNYFLNIAPELVGLSLLCHAWWTLICVGPFYALILRNRIVEENNLIITQILPNMENNCKHVTGEGRRF